MPAFRSQMLVTLVFAATGCVREEARLSPGESDCPEGQSDCSGACVDTATDPQHCGGCDATCTGDQVCSAGMCSLQCSGGTVSCGDECVDTDSDPNHCGNCSQPCATGACSQSQCTALPSCAALHAGNATLPSGVYQIDPDGPGSVLPFPSYCEMEEDGGGWTLAMKIDGALPTFVFGAAYWTDDEVLNPDAADLDTTEAKLPSFSSMPVSAVRLGMRVMTDTRWINFAVTATSLRSIFAGPYLPTNVGRAQWLSLLGTASLQDNCNQEGFNVAPPGGYSVVRLGIIGNQELDCLSPDSRLGFGGGGGLCGEDPNNSCGNESFCHPAGNFSSKAFGYLMIR